MSAPEVLLWRFLVGVLLPLWLLAGALDWWCHRRSGIERTSGVRESALHAAMLVQVGAPVLLVLFFELNGAVLALCALAVIAHLFTNLADLRWADGRRRITPVEQMAHGVLEVLPFVAAGLLACLAWDARGDFQLRWRAPPPGLAASILVASGLLAVLPFAEELRRCLRVRSSTSTSPPTTGAGGP